MPEQKNPSTKLAAVVQADPWSWIAWLFGGQIMAALAFLSYVGLPLQQVAVPLGLLGIGTAYGLLCRWLKRRFALSHQHYWGPALVYALFIFTMSSRSYSMQNPPSFSTNLFHPLEYAALAIFFCAVGYPVLLKIGACPLVTRVVLGGMVYGASDEIHQAFVSGRTASGLDLMLDLAGLVAGCGIFLAARWLQRLWLERMQPATARERP